MNSAEGWFADSTQRQELLHTEVNKILKLTPVTKKNPSLARENALTQTKCLNKETSSKMISGKFKPLITLATVNGLRGLL